MSARPRGTDSAQIVEVIETTSLVGAGVDGDPCRLVRQYWSKKGELLAERDDYEFELTAEPGEGIRLSGEELERLRKEHHTWSSEPSGGLEPSPDLNSPVWKARLQTLRKWGNDEKFAGRPIIRDLLHDLADQIETRRV